MLSNLEHYYSIFFLLGLLVVAAHARERFNEPSFPHKETLPRTVAPLRYLFLRRAYQKALLTYIAVSLLLYSVLVLPGPEIIPALSTVGVDNFPKEGWALLVALLLVGLVPNSKLKWLTDIEEWLRRSVHSWFLVPDGIVGTIGVLEDARYEPPTSQLNALTSPLGEKLRSDLKFPASSLRYRWARTMMLIASLRQMGAGAAHPLRKAAFEPFHEDFEAIIEKQRALAPDVEALIEKQRALAPDVDKLGDSLIDETEENLTRSVDRLLKQIYAYISWGVRHQADREQDVDQALEELGFDVPPTGRRRLSDIVIPAILLVAVITMLFWLTSDAVRWTMGLPVPTMHMSVVLALTSAVATSLMYGRAVFVALNRRSAQIEQKVWRQTSPRCLVPIAIRAGLVTWAVIVITTALWQLPATLQSLAGLAQMVKSLVIGDAAGAAGVTDWSFLPVRVATALPWLLAGAMASVLLASLVGGDVRRTGKRQRARDAIILGGGLGLAAALAQLIQTSLSIPLAAETVSFGFVPIIGLAGFACGAVLGFMVPQAYRDNLMTPPDPIMARVLRDLLRQAETTLGTRAAAEEWVFMPRNEFGGITPAEAVHYKTHATGVRRRLLESEAPRQREEARPDRSDRPVQAVIEGGRSLDSGTA